MSILLRFWRGFFPLILIILLQGCSLQQHQLNSLAQRLDNGHAEQVLAVLSQQNYPERDRVQYMLDMGLLLAVSGDFTAGIDALQSAKREINQLQASSISENVGAVTINETLRSYTSTASEKMLLQQLLILSYLLSNDPEGARVEVLQMQELAKELPDKGLSGLVASSYYLAGLVYELAAEPDNAMISYRQAYQVMETSERPIPIILQDSLLLFSHKLGLNAEYHRYVKQFGYEFSIPDPSKSQLVMLYWGGTVSAKQQYHISIYEPSLGYNISLALPYYSHDYTAPKPWSFLVQSQPIKTEIFDDVDSLARADLEAESAAIYATALARVIAKQTLLHEVKKQDNNGFVTLLVNISSIVSEMADVRSWNMLPANIQLQRVVLDAGTYYLQQPDLNQRLSLIKTKPEIANLMATTTTIKNADLSLPIAVTPLQLRPGKTVLLFYSSAAKKAHCYLSP